MGQPEEGEFGLLPGEDSSAGPDDAEHWTTVYEEMLSVAESFLEYPAASIGTSVVYRRVLHYRERLRYWRQERARGR
jgi:hypothetical protein